jgi:hypothetical protein
MGRSSEPRANYLDEIPARNVDHEVADGGLYVLLRPKFMTGPLARLLQPHLPRRHFRVKLDDLGSAVWELVDGARNVGQIADALAERLGERIEPRYERVSKFVHSLHQGAMIRLEQRPPAGGE